MTFSLFFPNSWLFWVADAGIGIVCWHSFGGKFIKVHYKSMELGSAKHLIRRVLEEKTLWRYKIRLKWRTKSKTHRNYFLRWCQEAEMELWRNETVTRASLPQRLQQSTSMTKTNSEEIGLESLTSLCHVCRTRWDWEMCGGIPSSVTRMAEVG